MEISRYSDDFRSDVIQQKRIVDIPQRRFCDVWVSVVVLFMHGGSDIQLGPL